MSGHREEDELMIHYGKLLSLCFVAWLTACSSERTEAQTAEAPARDGHPSHAPPTSQPIVVAPDGLHAQGAPCGNDTECSSKVCWRGFCARSNPVFHGGGSTAIGEACARDADCQSVFCDRGRCAQPLGAVNYGIECEPPPPRDRVMPCGAYICADGRCRSCQSDAECTYWMGAEKCTTFGDDIPGKQCGRNVEGIPPTPPAAPPTTTPRPPKP